METGAFTAYIDIAQLSLYAFWVFFAGLIWYLRQEDRREGYPLEDDLTGRYSKDPWLFVPPAKTFALAHGHGTVSVPNKDRDSRPIAAERAAAFPGAALVPTGDPMADGIGPGSWAERADVADTAADGQDRIVPMSVASEYQVAAEDFDPRGMPVVGCDGAGGGTVTDLWIDRSEQILRYLQIETAGGGTQLLPINFCVFKKSGRGKRHIYVHAITGAQFANVPTLANGNRVTRLEEERTVAYFGGGQLYATPQRQEPYV